LGLIHAGDAEAASVHFNAMFFWEFELLPCAMDTKMHYELNVLATPLDL
jgi:hypothetical protein